MPTTRSEWAWSRSASICLWARPGFDYGGFMSNKREGSAIERGERDPADTQGQSRAGDSGFIPALRFHRLTPLFDLVAAVAVRDRAFKRRVLACAAIAGGEEVLDVGCGTGTLAVAAARAAPGVRVTGLDADSSILARARKRAAGAGLEIGFDEGMSTELPYEDASFDLVLSTLFFHHLQDDAKRRTAAELMRVLRPGGQLVVGDLGRPQDPMMRVAVRVTVQLVDGRSPTALNVRGELPDVFAGAGLQAVSVRDRMRTPTGSYDVITATRPAMP